MAVMKTWEDEDVVELISLYSSEEKTVEELAEYFGRNTRSVVSKLVKLGIYRKPVNDKVKRSVKGMIDELEKILKIRIDGTNLSKKQNLVILVDAIKKMSEQSNNL